ncbi:MAG: hypothetical protein H0W87_00045 [Actinobacteria bacterium]|nr:hypothetical protein [Actinomycetota bacterium]
MRLLLTILLVCAAATLSPPALAGTSADQRLADRYAPVVALREQKKECGPGEPYRPISVEAVLGNSEVTLRGPGKGDPVVKTGPTGADLFGKGKGYYLDFPGNPLDPGCTYEKEARRWNGTRRPVVYAHVATQEGHPNKLALQYWFFYVFNDFNNKHESDWEMIQLVFHTPDAGAALDAHPYEVAYSQHEGGERAAWDDEKLQKDGTHVIVYPAGGSHADYYSTAVWLGRSGSEGFGCDDTSPPSVTVKPKAVLVPTAVESASDPYAWLGFTGRWGQREAGFNNGPTGPSTKSQWLRPIRWEENKLRPSSVQIPALHSLGPSVAGFFCGAVAAGSNVLTFTQQRPLLAVAILLGALALVALILTRTRWSPIQTESIESRRTIGQILRTAFRLYRTHRRLFLGLGAIFLPIGALFTGIEALLFEHLLGLSGLSGSRSGIGDVLGAGIGGLGALIAAAIVVSATAVALSKLSQGEVPQVRDVYRAVWARFWLLVSAVLRAGVTVIVLALTLVGTPVAVERAVRWAFVAQVCMLGDQPPSTPLRESAQITRSSWWRTFALTSVMNFPVVVLALVIGSVFLFLVSSAPLYFVELISSCVFALAYPYVGIATTLLYFDLVLSRPEPAPSTEPALA